MSNDQKIIEQIISDVCTKYEGDEINKHLDKEYLFIRPSGNPLNLKGWNEMMNSKDVTVKSAKLLSINKIEVGEKLAYACYTQHAVFNYKGTDNDDVAVFTLILRKQDGNWKVVFGQRSTGRSPNEPLPVF